MRGFLTILLYIHGLYMYLTDLLQKFFIFNSFFSRKGGLYFSYMLHFANAFVYQVLNVHRLRMHLASLYCEQSNPIQ